MAQSRRYIVNPPDGRRCEYTMSTIIAMKEGSQKKSLRSSVGVVQSGEVVRGLLDPDAVVLVIAVKRELWTQLCRCLLILFCTCGVRWGALISIFLRWAAL